MNQHDIFSNIPELLCIGVFCHDLHKGDFLLGGTASFASMMGSELGKKTGVLTSVGEDFKYFDLFKKHNIQLCNKKSSKTTVFQNIYEKGIRTQFIKDRSETLTAADLPIAWKKAPIVKFCLIADEVDFSLLEAFPDALVGASIQGWLRRWDGSGKISPKPMKWEWLKKVDIVFMSDADIAGFEDLLPKIISYAKMVVLTKGAKGAFVFVKDEKFHFPSIPVKEKDPTGAGDIFATAFLIKYHESGNIVLAAAFAHAAASFIVEEIGLKIPSLDKINSRFENYLSP